MTRHDRYASAIILLAAIAVVVGCGTRIDQASTTNIRGIDLSNFDTTCSPCEDFYQYANGTWLVNNPVPDEYSNWGTGHEVYERNNKLLKTILEQAAGSDAEQGSAAQKIGDFYASGMDTSGIEEAGIVPLRADLERIDAMASLDDLRSVLTDFHAEGLTLLFRMDAYEDLENSDRIILYAEQGGLGLPDRDYYTRPDEESIQLRRQYVEHMANMFGLLGEDSSSAQSRAEAVMAIETNLAEASLTRVELRDFSTWYDVKTIQEADRVTPNFPWTEYVNGIGVPEVKDFSLGPDKFFAEVNRLLTEVPLEDWKSYLRWHLVTRSAPYLSSEFVNEDFSFFSTTLRGIEGLQPRWKRALRWVNGSLGEVLGQLYVERAFPPETKRRALDMVENLRVSLKNRLNNLDWMSEETKAKALAKLEAFTPKIGYPDKWRDYSTLQIDRGPLVNNARRGRAFEMRRTLNKIGKPVDPTEWGMNPQMVNAYYNPVKNEVVFPAGILQPPFFDGEIDDAVNYGAMGAIIGHEMLHGFDDQGGRFDADGNMVNWWTPEDREKFEAHTAKLVEQFGNYIAIDSLHVNGRLTLGENIADMGGLRVSYDALQIALEGKDDPMIDGFAQEQRFFLSFAQAWRGNGRPEALKLQVNTDPHSPRKFRCLGPLSNMDEFAEAFGCQEDSEMMRPVDERIHIW